MNIEDKKMYLDKWFSYLQAQICKQFEKLKKSLKAYKNLFQPIGKKIIRVVVEHTKYLKMEKYLKKWV